MSDKSDSPWLEVRRTKPSAMEERSRNVAVSSQQFSVNNDNHMRLLICVDCIGRKKVEWRKFKPAIENTKD